MDDLAKAVGWDSGCAEIFDTSLLAMQVLTSGIVSKAMVLTAALPVVKDCV
ncbi:hypothetical protein DPMN_032940 [Dreissena polymorpha]|uniref:Uncharacterized protein n=1 Tax=Dreissena polymorpha TaxID=45954 RepID=A0A9D4M5R0_DREPO|nr:hypothetical protein DPMN_032940 [Dreissena polymorpha]